VANELCQSSRKDRVDCYDFANRLERVCGTIAGDTIRIDVMFPDTSTSVIHTDVSVPNSQEFDRSTFTLTANSILIDLDTPGCGRPGCIFINNVAFNGLKLTDLTNPSALSDWTVNLGSTTMAGFSEFISGGSIFIDFQGLPAAGQIALQAGDGTVAVPGPLPVLAFQA
jgi:hypothetical protein